MMSGIRSRNTRPELQIRKGLHALGFRFRLHDRTLAGSPDLVFKQYRAVIFVHGCFWHGHGCHLFKTPRTRPDFWSQKIARNRARDEQVDALLAALGWRRLTIWECALRGKFGLGTDEVLRQAAEWIQAGTEAAEISGAQFECHLPM
jgi:DNA mismatch endonuclease (patch repair protein)